jgi:predicted Zn finger-like uncharacterized protein
LEAGVIITCPECKTKYRYDEQRFDGSSSKRVKCTGCGHTFEINNPAFEPTEVGSSRADALEPTATQQPALSAEKVDFEAIPPLPSDARYSLAVIAGTQAGSVFQICKSRVHLGRGSAMDIQLRDSEVSRRHAVLEIRDPKVLLIDLGATNGTWFNGERIEKTEICHQDEFTLGSTTLMLIVTPVRDR